MACASEATAAAKGGRTRREGAKSALWSLCLPPLLPSRRKTNKIDEPTRQRWEMNVVCAPPYSGFARLRAVCGRLASPEGRLMAEEEKSRQRVS